MVRPACGGLALGTLLIVVARPAPGEFQYIEVERASCADCMKTYRLYAIFSEETDQILAVGGVPAVASFQFSASHPLFNDGGAFDGLIAEDTAGAPVAGPRDTWLTIGHAGLAGNDTGFSPGFLGGDGVHRAVEGASLEEDNGGWFDSDPGTPVTGTRILIAQLSFAPPLGEPFQGFAVSGCVKWQPAPGELTETPFSVFYGENKHDCPTDVTYDNVVDFQDLLLILSNWGPCVPDACCEFDVHGSGEVDLDDLLAVIATWGDCFE